MRNRERPTPSARRPGAAALGALVWGALSCGGCGDGNDAPRETGATPSTRLGARDPGDGRPVVLTVNEPLRAIAARIGGEAVDVRYPGPPDEDPAFWVPDDATVRAFQAADLVLRNGASYAKWTEQAALPFARTVDTGAAFADRLIVEADAVTHAHGPEGEHAHGGTAFTTWLDYAQAAEQARAVEAALARLVPAEREAFAARALEVTAELTALDERLLAVDPERRRTPLLASHPVYPYLARRYDLDVRSVHFEPDALPDDAGWAALDALLAERPASAMLWEGEPLEETVRRLAERGLSVIVFDPCGAPSEGSDFFAVQRANVERLVEALSGS